jgi:poly-gamma-glutamate synthesis protein (capsule biosynthesis protein)
LVVLLHGAAEFHAPTPRIQDTCRFLVEQGASAVVVQHPHVIGGWEEYSGGQIVYGQGALVMDEAIYRDRASFHEGILVRLELESKLPPRMEVIPFVQSSPVPGARKLQGEARDRLLESLEERNARVKDPAWVVREWQRFCDAREHGCVSSVLGHGRLLRWLNLRGALERWFYRRRLLGVRNMVLCETHRETLRSIFEKRRF